MTASSFMFVFTSYSGVVYCSVIMMYSPSPPPPPPPPPPPHTHTHRRTGKSLSFITRDNWQWARELTGILSDAGQVGVVLYYIIVHQFQRSLLFYVSMLPTVHKYNNFNLVLTVAPLCNGHKSPLYIAVGISSEVGVERVHCVHVFHLPHLYAGGP